MTMSASLHKPDRVRAQFHEGTSWLSIEHGGAASVTIFMPYDTAKAMADAWERASEAAQQKVAAE